MLSKIQKWGNSQGIRIPKSLLENSNIQIGEEVDITIQDGKIIVEPTRRTHGRYRIRDLASKMPKGYEPNEEDWGDPMGREAW